jgi:DNA repair protein RadD
MITLRKNQEEPVKIGTDYFLSGKSIPSLMVEPVAFGKSVVIAHIAHAIKDSGKTLCLQPSKELLEQNYNKLVSIGGSASIFSASFKQKEFGDITYATIGTIKNLGSEFKRKGYKYLIVDEADRYPRANDSMFGKFLKDSGIKSVLGFTATPFKLQTNSFEMQAYSLTKMLTARSKHGNFFKDIIHITQICDIIKDKYWTELLYEQYDFDTGKLIYNSTKAEYTDASIKSAYEDQNIDEKIIRKVRELTDRKSILVFVPSVSDAISLASRIPSAVAVYGDMPVKERDEAIELFRSGDVRVAINVNVLSIGFDYQEIDCIILGRPTASLSLNYQQLGRGTRIHPNKKNCLIVDFVGNTVKFGKIDDFMFKKVLGLWKLYGTGGVLLTGIPIHTIGAVTEESDKKEILRKEKISTALKDGKVLVTFGKFEGKLVEETPVWWRDWALINLERGAKTGPVLDEILRINNK